MNVRKGSALTSTIVGIACFAIVGGAGYALMSGQSVCSLLSACGVGQKASVVAVSDSSADKAGACSFAPTAATTAAAENKVAAQAECSYASDREQARWTVANGGAVAIPMFAAMTETGDAAQCDKAKAETCDTDTQVVAASQSKTTCADKAAKTECDKGAQVVEAAQTSDRAAKAQCDKDAQIVNAAQTQSDCAAKAECDKNAQVVEAAQTSDCAAKAQCDKDAQIVNAAQTQSDCAAKAECDKTTTAFTPVNDACPGSGRPVADGVIAMHAGFTVGFCCGGCQGKWEAQDDAAKTADIARHVSLVNEMCPTCPTMKGKSEHVALHKGFAVGFCGDRCKNVFANRTDAEKSEYIASQAKPFAEVCPNSGKPITVTAVALHRGYAVGFCNTGCRDKFEADACDAKDATVVRLVGFAAECSDKAECDNAESTAKAADQAAKASCAAGCDTPCAACA